MPSLAKHREIICRHIRDAFEPTIAILFGLDDEGCTLRPLLNMSFRYKRELLVAQFRERTRHNKALAERIQELANADPECQRLIALICMGPPPTNTEGPF